MTHDFDLDNFRDLPSLLTQIEKRRPFREGHVIVAIVRDPQGAQEIVSVDVLSESSELVGEVAIHDASIAIRDLVEAAPITEQDERDLACRPLTIVVRRGFAVITSREVGWMNAWKYSNHPRRIFTSDVVVVTEHGWADPFSDSGDHQPALSAV